MRTRWIAVAGWLLCLGGVAFAHRLDEYLQATLVTVAGDHVQASMRLIPGVAVSSAVIARIDRNGDGELSAEEQKAYAESVLGEWAFRVDGMALTPRLVSVSFPTASEIRDGLGEIHLEVTADVPRGGRERRLVLENTHKDAHTVYLMNALVPQDKAIEIMGQQRNATQSTYELDYV